MLQNKNTLKNNCNYCESPHGVVYIYIYVYNKAIHNSRFKLSVLRS